MGVGVGVGEEFESRYRVENEKGTVFQCFI